MAPAKPRANADESHGTTGHASKTDTAHSRDRNSHHGANGGAHHPAANGKARRSAAASNASASAAAAAAAAAATAAAAAAAAHQQQQQQQLANNTTNGAADAASALARASNPNIQWIDFERGVLHAYRRAFRLETPAASSNDFYRWILSQPGSIGLQSPTMMRRKELRRQSKTQLASAARKHFNGLGVQENDIIVDFLHKVQTHEIARLRRPRRMGSNAREVDG
ncbi:hypothetical protein SPI_00608 [Niveomyces insectorum RCEF 264]|uniref:Histone deacetylase complex subunit SAP30 Sin3 binding domain-containing protein n=1 Tax=Niveomyces insectorum RCEF 264 TaxID=1081102 RepID=A0A168A8Z4_9HYPO|nr:hypothetical protein SPI_00608 [Niveomyces insectorum RCEF 264]